MTLEAIGPYRVVRQLGEGGQGVVYLATAPDGTRVAVKVLREGLPGDGRFAKEIAAARRVEPFCIAQVLDASLGARPYIVTEYVDGPSLQNAGLHAGADLQRLAVATATALAAVHRAGVVHRDFKPANVLLGRDGPRVIDFGIARAMDASLTRTSSIVGTPAYMAPEQFMGAAAGPAVDVFAWGAVMVYAATGAPPFGNDSVPAVLRRIQYEEPRLDGVPEPLRSIVYACLAKDPAARPAMQDVLFRLIGGQTPPPPAPGRGPGHVAFPGGPPHASFPGGPSHAPFPGGPSHAPFPGPGVGPGHPRQPPVHHLQTGPVRANPGNRRTTALLAGGAAVVVAGAVAAAWLWSPIWPGRTTTAAIVTTPTPTPSAPATGTTKATKSPHPTSKPRPTKTTKTPKAPKTSATTHPTTEPTGKPTSRPTTRPTTAKPTATSGGSGGVTSVAFTYEGDKVGDCWRNDMNIWAKVAATGTYSYRWLVNGQNQGRQQGTPSSKPLLPSITWKGEGTYNIVFEVVTPKSFRKSVAVKICSNSESWGEGW
ncbi:serine/threonine protein kinase [Nonomuraea sp. NPDC049400]|uniref:serine/threonine protein kinase n=1 Tax=Nonomuraea sp. NPDC049400 TaxID=3364352 RepID=UPI0037898FAE